MFQDTLAPLFQRLHPTLNHLTQALHTIAHSDTPIHSLCLDTTASLTNLMHTFLSHNDHIIAQATSIAMSTPPHPAIHDLPNTLNTLTQHFTSRFLKELHTILYISINDIYAQLAHSFYTLNTYFPSGISNQI